MVHIKKILKKKKENVPKAPSMGQGPRSGLTNVRPPASSTLPLNPGLNIAAARC